MWNHQTDRMFLEMREDAVLIFEQDSHKLLYLNPAAAQLFPNTDSSTVFSDLIQHEKIENMLTAAAASGRLIALPMEESIWFPEHAMLHCVCAEWDAQNAFILTIDRRDYSTPPEAMQMMKAVLTSAYFISVRIDTESKCAAIINDKNILMNTQARFPSYSQYLDKYAETVIHPEDREQFRSCFSEAQIRLFLEANTAPSCTIRRAVDEEYRWASFTLAALDQNVIMLFGKDNNEQHLVQERSDRYRSKLESVSLRNRYILSSVKDIFRLMIHVNLSTHEAVVCSIHPELEPFFSIDQVYRYEDIVARLMHFVHPEDRESLKIFHDLNSLPCYLEPNETAFNLTYRRISAQQEPDPNYKWTRSVFTIIQTENGTPTEAIYAVQDVDKQTRKEIAVQRAQQSLSEQFYTLIQNRYIWFIDNDYGTRISKYYRIENQNVQPPIEYPFGQFFERIIMPNVHPEDFKKVALALLPITAEDNYQAGKRQITIDFRSKINNNWRFVRGEMYLQKNEDGVLHTMIYVSDINDEVTSRNNLTRSEHEQLEMHRKVDHILTDTFIHVGEVDLDADTIRHYRLENESLVPEDECCSFRDYIEHYAERFIHPDQQIEFNRFFSYQSILRAAREHGREIKKLFLVSPEENQTYLWCNIGIKFLTNESGKSFALTYVENVNDEIKNRDEHLHMLQQKKKQLLENLRNTERAKIRRAHVFMNIASQFQLALNRIYGALDRLERELPEDARRHHDTGLIFTACEQLSAMTSCSRDLLLMENNQLPLLREPTNLLQTTRKILVNFKDLFIKKNIRLHSYTTQLQDEIILGDSRRFSFIIENIFFNVLRSLPDNSEITFHLAETPIPGEDKAWYELTLMMQGDSVSFDMQKGLLSPIPQNDPMNSVEAEFFLNNPDYHQFHIYLSKRLISIMGGTLELVALPNHASAVVLRIPFDIRKNPIVFPLRMTFGKRALVWDSHQAAAIATIKMLRESGIDCDLHSDFEGICAHLKSAAAQNTPYDLLVIRQSHLGMQKEICIPKLRVISPSSRIILIDDVHMEQQMDSIEAEGIFELKAPVFRSEMAAALRSAFSDPSAKDS